MRLLRTPLVRPLVAATIAGLALSAAPAEAGSGSFSASYKLKAGARSGISETAREVADIRKVMVASSAENQLRVAIKTDEVPAPSSRIDGVYTVAVKFDSGEVQTISYTTDTVSVTSSLGVSTGLLDLGVESEVTLRRNRVDVQGEGCSSWSATVNRRSDTIALRSDTCGDARFVDQIAVEAVAVTDADVRVGHDASGKLRHNVHIR
jgi:hypothetical protein